MHESCFAARMDNHRAQATMTERAKALRKTPTPAEAILWRELRGRRLGVKFRRQHPHTGFILDFYAASRALAVEIDGPTHETKRDHDDLRDAWLRARNVRTLRFTNDEVENALHQVLAKIRDALELRAGRTLRHATPRLDGPPTRSGGGRGGGRS